MPPTEPKSPLSQSPAAPRSLEARPTEEQPHPTVATSSVRHRAQSPPEDLTEESSQLFRQDRSARERRELQKQEALARMKEAHREAQEEIRRIIEASASAPATPATKSAVGTEHDDAKTVLTEEPSINSVTPEGFLQKRWQVKFADLFGKFRAFAVEQYLELGSSCGLVILIDALLEASKRRKRWPMMKGLQPFRKGYFPIPDNTARYLITKCEAAGKLAYLHLLTLETLDGFIEVLRIVLQPAVSALLAGSLQLECRLPAQTVALLSVDQRAALSKALYETVRLADKDQLTVESFDSFRRAVEGALESIGRPPQPIAPYQASTHANEHSRCLRIWLGDGASILKAFEKGSLSFNLLETFVRRLHGSLCGSFPNSYSFD